MVSLRSRLVEAPAPKLKTSTADHSSQESEGGQPASAKGLDSVGLSELSQLMTAVTDVPSLLDVVGITELAEGLTTDVNVDQSELNDSRVEVEEGDNISNTANEITKRSSATFSRDIIKDDTARYENETNNAYQSLPRLGSTEAALSVVPTEDQLHLISSTGQTNCGAQFKRKHRIDEIETGKNLVSVIDGGEDPGDARPRAHPRKLRKISVRRYGGSENLWMGNTLEGIEAVIKNSEDEWLCKYFLKSHLLMKLNASANLSSTCTPEVMFACLGSPDLESYSSLLDGMARRAL